MNAAEIRDIVLHALRTVAPEMDPAALRPDAAIRGQLDIDSMDALNFFIRIHDRLGVDIPEADYRKLNTLDECVAYLQQKLG